MCSRVNAEQLVKFILIYTVIKKFDFTIMKVYHTDGKLAKVMLCPFMSDSGGNADFSAPTNRLFI